MQQLVAYLFEHGVVELEETQLRARGGINLRDAFSLGQVASRLRPRAFEVVQDLVGTLHD